MKRALIATLSVVACNGILGNEPRERYRPPTEYVELAVLCCRQHLNAHRAFELRPATVVELFESLDGFRKKDRVEQFLLVCTADKRGRLGLADWLRKAFAAAAAIEAKPFVERGIAGPAIGEAVRRARIAAVAALKPPDESRTG